MSPRSKNVQSVVDHENATTTHADSFGPTQSPAEQLSIDDSPGGGTDPYNSTGRHWLDLIKAQSED